MRLMHANYSAINFEVYICVCTNYVCGFFLGTIVVLVYGHIVTSHIY